MEHRTTALLFSNAHWIWSEDYHYEAHKDLGKYVEVFFAKGWDDRDVTEVLKEYYTENFDNLF